MWEWTLVMTCCQFSIRLQASFFFQTHHNRLWVWWQGERSLLCFSNLSWLALPVFSLGVIVRFWLQFSSQRGECDCSSRGGGQRGLPGKQSGQFYLIFDYLWHCAINIGLKCPRYNTGNLYYRCYRYKDWSSAFVKSFTDRSIGFAVPAGFPRVLPESLSE